MPQAIGAPIKTSYPYVSSPSLPACIATHAEAADERTTPDSPVTVLTQLSTLQSRRNVSLIRYRNFEQKSISDTRYFDKPAELHGIKSASQAVKNNNKSAQSNLGRGPRRGSCARRWVA